MSATWIRPMAPLALVALAALARAAGQEAHVHDVHAARSAADAIGARSAPWPARTLELAGSLPVQDGGRIKPLSTYASFLLLRLHGTRSVTTPAGERLGPIAWLLDLLFFPDASGAYPLFLVQDAQAIEAIGVSVEGKKRRDRYSFDELRPGLQRLFALAGQYQAIEEKDRSSVQQQVFLLANNVDQYLALAAHLEFARQTTPVGSAEQAPGLAQVFAGRDAVRLSDVLERAAQVRALQAELVRAPERAAESEALSTLLHGVARAASGAHALALIPPVGAVLAEPEWLSPSDLLLGGLQDGAVAPVHAQIVREFEALVDAAADPARFQTELAGLQERSVALATARGEYAKVPLEIRYYGLDLLGRSQVVFVLSFLLAAGLWLRPRSRWLYRATSAAAVVATALVVAAIAMRCVIRGRPPVSTLYETIVFVTAVGTTTALLAELFTRQRIALSAAAVLGLIGLFFANGYETLDKRDTMPSLVAVLDTNFWLATHVTAITIGYSAGVLAALLASIYLLTKVVGLKKSDPTFHRGLGRIVYGVLCFGLIFSTVGTILGGIWANDSWGRFWGWDPKENGALLIVLSQIVILHARMAGLLREHGVCMAAALGGTVVAFSWFGVNLLGVGLHSYGFTSGIHNALWTYYWVQWGIVGLGGLHWLLERSRARAARAPASRPMPQLGARPEPTS